MSSKLLLLASASALALSACATGYKDIGQEDLALGESVRYNAAVQTINPDPIYPEGSAMPGDNGDHGAQAVARYRTDKVSARHKAEVSASQSGLSTTQGTGGGSGGGGGGPK